MAITASKTRILIVEDEPGIVDFLEMGLASEGFEVASEADGLRGLQAFESFAPALVILDVMLPGIDGMELCRRIRARSDVPVIILTAKGEVESRVDGFDAGADDYVPKPFRFEELLARVRAVLRRVGEGPARDLTFADVHLAVGSREVTRRGRPIILTTREFDLLTLFLRQPRHVLSKAAILNALWGSGYYGDTNVVEVYIRYLRRKLGDPPLIHTLRGAGYVLREPVLPHQDDG